ncbi:hypothetical protein, partial [Nonomuraea glycinis]|uniref:hypothetical protein n=1 Tax=Nonomuraea glycinis TaxID=2047744 RepID=UPI001E34D2FE
NTLLSSQETDAYIPAPTLDQGCAAEALISSSEDYQIRTILVKPPDLGSFGRPFRGNPHNLPELSALVQSCGQAARRSGSI